MTAFGRAVHIGGGSGTWAKCILTLPFVPVPCSYSVFYHGQGHGARQKGESIVGRKRKQLNYWESGKRAVEPGERFARIGGSLLRNPAFLKLPYSARFLYIAMVESCQGKPEFTFTLSDFTSCGYTCQTFARAKDSLIQGGFIEIVESGWATRTPNKYRFSEKWKV